MSIEPPNQEQLPIVISDDEDDEFNTEDFEDGYDNTITVAYGRNDLQDNDIKIDDIVSIRFQKKEVAQGHIDYNIIVRVKMFGDVYL